VSNIGRQGGAGGVRGRGPAWILLAWMLAVVQPWLMLCCEPAHAGPDSAAPAVSAVKEHPAPHDESGCDPAETWLIEQGVAKFDKSGFLDLPPLRHFVAYRPVSTGAHVGARPLAIASSGRDQYLRTHRLRL